MDEELNTVNVQMSVPEICDELFYSLGSPFAGSPLIWSLGHGVANAPEQEEECELEQ